MKKVSFHIAVLLTAIAFIAAACGGSSATSPSSPKSTPRPTPTTIMMHLPACDDHAHGSADCQGPHRDRGEWPFHHHRLRTDPPAAHHQWRHLRRCAGYH